MTVPSASRRRSARPSPSSENRVTMIKVLAIGLSLALSYGVASAQTTPKKAPARKKPAAGAKKPKADPKATAPQPDPPADPKPAAQTPTSTPASPATTPGT